MSGIVQLIGSEVLLQDAKVSTADFAAQGKVIGLYFSAHWCPPCRGFTPQLAKWYTDFKQTDKGKNLEIIFVSSDKDDASFKEYFGEMPWHALPFEDREKKGELSKVFKVSGIPKLVFVDGPTGQLITGDGRSMVTEDPQGEQFPWRPTPLPELLSGEALKGKEKVDLAKALEGNIRGFYFSAHWCPPCRAFTPTLSESYNKLKAAGKNFELVFVSSDRSQEAFDEYHGTMPFLAFPYGDERIKKLSAHFEISGIPTLVILDENNQIITENGRGRMSKDPNGEEFPWYPKDLEELTEDSVSVVNEQACLIYITGDDVDEAGVKKSVDQLSDVAKDYSTRQKASRSTSKVLPPLSILYQGLSSEDLVDTLRTYAKLPDRNPLVVILNIPEQQKYALPEGEITQDKIKQLVKDFEEGTLTFASLKD